MADFPTGKVPDHAAFNAVAVAKSDETVIPMTRALFVGGAGAVTVRMRSGNDCTFTGVTAGSILPIQCDKVLSTGTDATNMVAMY